MQPWEVGEHLEELPAFSPQRRQKLESEKQWGMSRTGKLIDARQYSRFKLDVDVRIYPRCGGMVMGRTVDISETGLAAMLKIEILLDQVVRLEFKLVLDPVSVRALVRQRNAFRYGFQFVEPDSDGQDLISRFCRDLAPPGLSR